MASNRKRLPKLPKGSVTPVTALVALALFAVFYIVIDSSSTIKAPQHAPSGWQVCFTPNRRCQQIIIDEINKASETILVQAYSFTDIHIAEALVAAKKRNIEVKVILDHSNRRDKRSQLKLMITNNIPVHIDHPQGIAHNKVMIIDDNTVITGSYNFSAAAYKRNTENLLVIKDEGIAKIYHENWDKRWLLSKAVQE